MNYKYRCKNEIIEVNVDEENKTAIVFYKGREGCPRTIIEGNDGKFFTWNRQKIYLNDYITISMKELKQRVEKDERISKLDFDIAIFNDGIENVRLMVPNSFFLSRSGGKAICKIEYYKPDSLIVTRLDDNIKGLWATYSLVRSIQTGSIDIVIEEDETEDSSVISDRDKLLSEVKMYLEELKDELIISSKYINRESILDMIDIKIKNIENELFSIK